MSSKKVYNLKDKVFAKIRGYPPWPAIISGVKADTPSRQRYNVYFYGTGERAECKSDELFPYEENKSKLGKPNKRKYFSEALLQIEDDNESSVLPGDNSQVSATSSNTSHIDQEPNKFENANKVEKSNESNVKSDLACIESPLSKGKKSISSRKSLGLSISKGTKRKISDVKSESSSKKSLSLKPKILESLKLKESPFVLVEALKESDLERVIIGHQKMKQAAKENASAANVSAANVSATDVMAATVSAVEPAPKIIDKQPEPLNTTESILETSDVSLDTSKTVKSLSKVKNSSTSSSEISSTNSANVGQVSRSGRKIKPKKYSDYENDKEAPKRSRLPKENSKSSEKNTGNNETDSSFEQNDKPKDTNSEIKKTPKTQASASVPRITDSVTNDLKKINDEISEDNEMPATIKDLMVGALSDIETGWKKAGPKKTIKIDFLRTEVDLLDYGHKLRVSLRTDHVDYEGALDSLERIIELNINALMLKKHQEIVETIQKVSRYIGNPVKWNLNEEETIIHEERSTQIRRKAEMVINKFTSLFTIPNGQTFQEIYDKEVEQFFTNTKHLACDQIYGITSEKLII